MLVFSKSSEVSEAILICTGCECTAVHTDGKHQPHWLSIYTFNIGQTLVRGSSGGPVPIDCINNDKAFVTSPTGLRTTVLKSPLQCFLLQGVLEMFTVQYNYTVLSAFLQK